VDDNERRSQAIGQAYQQWAATPDAERVYRPDEAIKYLVAYVVVSIAIGSRTRDVLLLKSLPAIIEPFVPLSPVVEAMWQNAIATRESVCDGQLERYITRSLALYERLEKMTPEQLPHVDRIRHAIEFGVGVSSANMGLASATRWAALLEQDAMQRISALYLRKAIRLQAGDWQGAEEFRKKAELLALQSRTGQMFDSTITLELAVHALARDLTGLKQVIDRIEVRAKRLPGWVCYRHVGEGEFQYACGNAELALAAFERAIALTAPDPDDPSRVLAAYPVAAAGVVASLVDLGQFEKAKSEGIRALDVCKAHGIGAQAHPLSRALSIAEAKLGDYSGASARLDAVIRAQTELGVTGLFLGASYEARARVAIWAGDEPAAERFGRLTAQEYRHGLGSPLGARYERLMDEARRKVALTLPKLWHFESTRAASRQTADAVATQLLQGAESVEERGARVLSVLCTGRASSDGFLYLCSDRGPTLVASQGAAEPGGLLGYVSDHLRRELQAGDGETAIVSEEDLAAEPPTVFTDEGGRILRPIFLTALVDEVPHYAAIAVVVEGPSESQPMDAALTAALAGHLIDAGDTPGIAASA
jgi:tetratricopeptide (TPR) repeat protein